MYQCMNTHQAGIQYVVKTLLANPIHIQAEKYGELLIEIMQLCNLFTKRRKGSFLPKVEEEFKRKSFSLRENLFPSSKGKNVPP